MLFYSLLIQIYFRKRVVRENQCGGTGGSLHTAEVQANSPAQENVVYIYYVCQIYQQYQYQYQIYVPAISISNIPAISILKAIMFASGRCSSQLWSRKDEF